MWTALRFSIVWFALWEVTCVLPKVNFLKD